MKFIPIKLTKKDKEFIKTWEEIRKEFYSGMTMQQYFEYEELKNQLTPTDKEE